MVQMHNVTMSLTESDVKNTERLRLRLHANNNAEAVSAALTITSFLSDVLDNNKELIIRSKNGDMEKVIIPGITEKDSN